jgi:hypothetical protein
MGMVVVGVYVLPSVTAKFQGSHTMEFNASSNGISNASGMDCGACHSYIQTELNATGEGGTDRVLTQHINALNNGLYANDDNTDVGFLNIGNFSIALTETGKVCPLCHSAESSIDGSHTQVVTRVCTDRDCHGYNVSNNARTPVYEGQNVTAKINGSLSNDVHGGWYSALQEVESNRPKANESDPGHWTTNYGQGYLTCLACHTHFGMNINVTRPQSFNINISIAANGDVTIPGVEINQTDRNTTLSIKDAHVSVW